MKKEAVNDQEITLKMPHEEALMIVATFGDIAFASPFDPTFVTRTGFTQEKVGKVAKELRRILNECEISE